MQITVIFSGTFIFSKATPRPYEWAGRIKKSPSSSWWRTVFSKFSGLNFLGFITVPGICLKIRNSFDQYHFEEIEKNQNLKKTIHESIYELWNLCKKELLSGEKDQIILDEIFLAIERKIIDKDDLISTLENRFISGDVILTGTDIPKDLLLMANQITELRS